MSRCPLTWRQRHDALKDCDLTYDIISTDSWRRGHDPESLEDWAAAHDFPLDQVVSYDDDIGRVCLSADDMRSFFLSRAERLKLPFGVKGTSGCGFTDADRSQVRQALGLPANTPFGGQTPDNATRGPSEATADDLVAMRAAQGGGLGDVFVSIDRLGDDSSDESDDEEAGGLMLFDEEGAYRRLMETPSRWFNAMDANWNHNLILRAIGKPSIPRAGVVSDADPLRQLSDPLRDLPPPVVELLQRRDRLSHVLESEDAGERRSGTPWFEGPVDVAEDKGIFGDPRTVTQLGDVLHLWYSLYPSSLQRALFSTMDPARVSSFVPRLENWNFRMLATYLMWLLRIIKDIRNDNLSFSLVGATTTNLRPYWDRYRQFVNAMWARVARDEEEDGDEAQVSTAHDREIAFAESLITELALPPDVLTTAIDLAFGSENQPPFPLPLFKGPLDRRDPYWQYTENRELMRTVMRKYDWNVLSTDLLASDEGNEALIIENLKRHLSQNFTPQEQFLALRRALDGFQTDRRITGGLGWTASPAFLPWKTIGFLAHDVLSDRRHPPPPEIQTLISDWNTFFRDLIGVDESGFPIERRTRPRIT